MTRRLLFDVSGLLQWYAFLANPSGVQRVMENLLRSEPIVSDARVEMIGRVLGSDRFFQVERQLVTDLGDPARRPLAIARLRGLFTQSMPWPTMSRRWRNDLRAFHLPYMAMGLAGLGFVWEALSTGRIRSPPLKFVLPPAEGDAIVGLGDFWCHRGHVDALVGLKARTGARLVHMVHDLFAIERPEWTHPVDGRTFLSQFERLAPHVDHWLVNSRFVAQSLERWLETHGLRSSAVGLVPMGWDTFDNERFDVQPEDRTILARHGLADTSYVLHVGTIEPRKNLVALIDAMARLSNDFGAAAPGCVLVGRDGWKSDDVHERLRSAGSQGGRVRWIKKLPDGELSAFYRGALFTVVTSLGEGWGLPVQESLAHGVPCIATRAGGLQEAGEGLAHYVDPDDPDQLFSAMAHWIADAGALAAQRVRIRRRFQAGPPFVTWDQAGIEVLKVA